MVGLPHGFFVREGEREIGVKLPREGEYAVGNVFFRKPERPDWRHDAQLKSQQKTFAEIADKLNLRVLGWRHVPTDNTILGPAALSREPIILQPFVVLKSAYGSDTKESQNGEFDEKYFERQLYVLRKHSTHTIKLETGFYICSLSKHSPMPFSGMHARSDTLNRLSGNKNVVYKGQLSPPQVYSYYHDL